MMERITDLPDHVVGITATGKITGTDYETVLIPAVEKTLQNHPQIRLLYHMTPQVEGFDAAALWDDTKVGLKHCHHFEKIAVLTDTGWMRNAIKFCGFMMPGEIRVFASSELAEAKQWVIN